MLITLYAVKVESSQIKPSIAAFDPIKNTLTLVPLDEPENIEKHFKNIVMSRKPSTPNSLTELKNKLETMTGQYDVSVENHKIIVEI